MNIHAMSAGRHVDNAALAVLNAQRWKQDRADF